MSDISLQVDEASRIYTMARDSAGAGVTGASLSLLMYRNSDGAWWDGSVFQPTATPVAMVETDSVNLPGVYHHDFTPRVAFRGVVYITTATAGVVNDPFVATVVTGSWLDNIDMPLSDLASGADISTVLSRLGSTFLDNEWLRVHALLREILNNQKALFKLIK